MSYMKLKGKKSSYYLDKDSIEPILKNKTFNMKKVHDGYYHVYYYK